MLLSVKEFCYRVERNPDGLVERLQELTGRETGEEERAWLASLPRLAEVLRTEALQRLHIHFERCGYVDVEYQLPSSGCWCDAVILGHGNEGPSALIVELKHWITSGDRPGPTESLIEHAGSLLLHPSDQVRGYTEYCQRFHSAVRKHDATVRGCVLFTRSTQYTQYLHAPHDNLVRDYPIFGVSHDDRCERMPAYIAKCVNKPNEQFAEDFAEGIYEQDRRFVRHVAKLFSDTETAPFVLLDEQRRGYEVAMRRIEQALERNDARERLVVMIQGPPGSGKSILAAQLWAALANHPLVNGDVVFATTSGCQRAVWEGLFKSVARSAAGAGLVKPSNSYNPGLRSNIVNSMREHGHEWTQESWRENLEIFERSKIRSRCRDLQYDVSIVDEAHALIDPTAPNARGISPSGWVIHAGPQAWHIVRASRVSVFLMDSHQSFRDNETTVPDAIERFAIDHGASEIVTISLESAQFRCGGSKVYADWVDHILQRDCGYTPTTGWRRTAENLEGPFEFEIVSDPLTLENALRARHDEGRSVRLAASFARERKTKNLPDPHSLPIDEMDFNLPSERHSAGRWAKIWNYAPEQDYTLFVQGPNDTPIGRDPLCEIGCPYVLRGFDFDYIGLLWLSDLVWRSDRWVAQLERVHETGWIKTRAAVKRDSEEHMPILLDRLKRGYRILMTRAIRGLYIWCEDDETRERLETALKRR